MDPPVDKIAVQDWGTRDTSRAVAKAVLPKLQFWVDRRRASPGTAHSAGRADAR